MGFGAGSLTLSRTPRQKRKAPFETLRDPGQAPRLVLHGASAGHAERQGIARIHISITHDGGMAMAVAVAESD